MNEKPKNKYNDFINSIEQTKDEIKKIEEEISLKKDELLTKNASYDKLTEIRKKILDKIIYINMTEYLNIISSVGEVKKAIIEKSFSEIVVNISDNDLIISTSKEMGFKIFTCDKIVKEDVDKLRIELISFFDSKVEEACEF